MASPARGRQVQSPLSIYRELGDPSPSLVAWLEARDQLYPVIDNRGRERLYVENDTPRPEDITEEIVGNPTGIPFKGCTVGFALFDQEGQHVGTYATLVRAEEAARSAKVVVTTNVDVQPDAGWDSIDGAPEPVVDDDRDPDIAS